MFTGIVKEVGRIAWRKAARDGLTLGIEAPGTAAVLQIGDSVATQGVCLTCVRVEQSTFVTDVSLETLRLTTLGKLAEGDRVNLEPALRLSDPIGGHLVSGHVDATGNVEWIRDEGEGKRIAFRAPAPLMRYVIQKGSIAVDGVSLTVAAVTDSGFQVALIPHTLAVTTLGSLRPGDAVNLEVDLIGKYVERLLSSGSGKAPTLWESLARAGYIDASENVGEGIR